MVFRGPGIVCIPIDTATWQVWDSIETSLELLVWAVIRGRMILRSLWVAKVQV